ncbi:hypothetical protein [Qipengyuania marisflavi]|uniref:Nuclear transport factor 2 family protein n=1 Tax=Qipengyuania marisflavi TaxID=2486356 RepID=A0A5S3P9C9_9SPHN|nr:hypothetical protein [Qipengyuania marisflavi]TMM50061.1 hypothetical protein FEV51_02370 [Qipengyuania marisflavi]
MDRRHALGLAVALPALATAGRAAACSIAVDSPEVYAERVPQVVKLFNSWWQRDEIGFLGALVGPRNTDGTPTEAMIRQYIAVAEDREPQRLFDTMFTEKKTYKQLVTVTAVGERVFVAASEQGAGGIGPDCSNMPILHLFLVGYEYGRPRTIRLIESEVWSGYGQASSWNL